MGGLQADHKKRRFFYRLLNRIRSKRAPFLIQTYSVSDIGSSLSKKPTAHAEALCRNKHRRTTLLIEIGLRLPQGNLKETKRLAFGVWRE